MKAPGGKKQRGWYTAAQAANLPDLQKYIRMKDLCRMFGVKADNNGYVHVRTAIQRRLKLANGKLDSFDPRRGPGRYWEVSMPALRALFPERFDKQEEVIRHLEKRLKEFDQKFEHLAEELEREKRISRKRDDLLKEAIEKLAQNSAA